MKNEIKEMYIYKITINQVSLEEQGEWDFTFNANHVIKSDKKLNKEMLDDIAKDITLEIEADTDEPYELGYYIEDYDFIEEGGVNI